MSWTQVRHPYLRFLAVSESVSPGYHCFPVTIWEVTDEHPNGYTAVENSDFASRHLTKPAALRIITAPLDELCPQLGKGIARLCEALKIPHEFLSERIHAVCHSYGTRTDPDDKGDGSSGGFCAWFHYLCKAVEPDKPQQPREWDRSAFFLRKHSAKDGGGATLVMFAPPRAVAERIEQFIGMGCFQDVIAEPLALFDLVLDGLFREVDLTLWKLLNVIFELEMGVIGNPGMPQNGHKRTTDQIDFSELHSWTKHIINLGEVADSCIRVVEGVLATIDRQEQQRGRQGGSITPHAQVHESLLYRHSLFTSLRLRLTSLQHRVANITHLAFNLVTQQDSRLMIRDSASMTVISFLTVLFLPAVSVASIMGSEMFQTNYAPRPQATEDNTDTVLTSPLFKTMWYIAGPLTFIIMAIAVAYRWWDVAERKLMMNQKGDAWASKRPEWYGNSTELGYGLHALSEMQLQPARAHHSDPILTGRLPQLALAALPEA